MLFLIYFEDCHFYFILPPLFVFTPYITGHRLQTAHRHNLDVRQVQRRRRRGHHVALQLPPGCRQRKRRLPQEEADEDTSKDTEEDADEEDEADEEED